MADSLIHNVIHLYEVLSLCGAKSWHFVPHVFSLNLREPTASPQ